MASRVVTPDVTILRLSRGDTLTVKQRLNAGERRAMFDRMSPSGEYKRSLAGLSALLAYVVNWSVLDPGGKLLVIEDKPDAVRAAAFDSLEPGFFDEIETAVLAHHDAMIAQRDAEKNDRDGANESPALSPSPVGVAGGMSGLTN